MFRVLVSPDEVVRMVAMDQLSQTVSHRRRLEDPSLQDLMSFMNSPVSPNERTTRDVKSLWSDTRLSLMAVSLRLDLSSDAAMLTMEDDSAITAQHLRGLNIYLRRFFRNDHLQSRPQTKGGLFT